MTTTHIAQFVASQPMTIKSDMSPFQTKADKKRFVLSATMMGALSAGFVAITIWTSTWLGKTSLTQVSVFAATVTMSWGFAQSAATT